MKKALVLILTAFLFVSLFIACGPEPKVQITIKFDGNGGGGTMADVTAYAGETTDLPPNTFEKEGWYFDGWNTKADGTGKWYHDTEIVRFNENTTLYAQWDEFGPAIVFHANGGQGTMRHQHVEKNVPTHLNKNKYTWQDHLFAGWNTKKDGSGDSYADEAIIETDKNVILYAQWAIVLTPDTNKWTDGNVYTLGDEDVSIGQKVFVSGNVTLIIPEERTLTSTCGIIVKEGNSLTIKGSGKLNATGLMGHAGIGGDDHGDTCGDITIEGGIINVLGGLGAAGIGGGIEGNGGNVKITGGTVTATAGDDELDHEYIGKGIGRGYGASVDGSLVVKKVTMMYSTDGGNTYVTYEGTDYSTRYQYMKAE